VCALRDHQVVSVANEDSVSLQYYGVATCELVRVSDALAIVDGRGELPPAPFDVAFANADKTRFIKYAEALLSNDRVLRP
jgi:predicted O-methyltransferase YrrM